MASIRNITEGQKYHNRRSEISQQAVRNNMEEQNPCESLKIMETWMSRKRGKRQEKGKPDKARERICKMARWQNGKMARWQDGKIGYKHGNN